MQRRGHREVERLWDLWQDVTQTRRLLRHDAEQRRDIVVRAVQPLARDQLPSEHTRGPHIATAIDRVALYLIPLQLFVFARLPRLARTVKGRTLLVLGVVGYYSAVQFVWLNFATHAQYWLPYQFMPLW